MLKSNIFKKIMLNGNKQTSEKIFLKSLKIIQKIHYNKKFEDIVKFGLINSSPVVYLKTIKRKRKQTMEFPFLLQDKLRLSGIGYKVFESRLEDRKLLHLKLGNSHSLYYKIPEKIVIKIIQSSKLFIFGDDYAKVCQIAALIRSYKKPEPYKGKGILYANEIIKLKEGKKI